MDPTAARLPCGHFPGHWRPCNDRYDDYPYEIHEGHCAACKLRIDEIYNAEGILIRRVIPRNDLDC